MYKRKINFNMIVILFPILIIVAKIIRYTIMKDVLVDNGIGHSWINIFNSDLTNKEILMLPNVGLQNITSIIIFNVLNIFKIDNYFAYEIYITVLFNIILFIMFYKLKTKISIFQAVFLSLFIIVLNVFDFCLSKDPIQMIFFIVIFYVLLSNIKHKQLMSFIIVIISSIIFRAYYILIIAFALILKIILEKIINGNSKKTIQSLCIGVIIITAFYILMLVICHIAFPETYTELIRVRTRTSSAFSDIRNIFYTSNNILLFGADYLFVIIRLLFPLELMRGGIKYIMYILFQLVITYSILKSLKNYKLLSEIEKFSLLIFLAFVFTSATFEPDFGSWIRHEAVLYPLLLIINKLIKNKYIDKEQKDGVN